MNNENKTIDWKIILLIVLAVVIVGGFIMINRFNAEKHSLENKISNLTAEINSLRGNISSIYDNVDDRMKKEASLLTGVEYSFGEIDTEKHTVPLLISIIPKTITDDMTATVRVGDKTVEFVKNGNVFTAEISVGIFLEYGEHPILNITTDGGIKTEYIEDIDIGNLYLECLPCLYSGLHGSTRMSSGFLKIEGQLYVDCKPSYYGQDVTVSKVELVTEVNGKDIDRLDIPDEIDAGTIDYRLNKSYRVSNGDELMMYTVAVDSHGYVHKTLIEHWYNSDGPIAEYSYGEEEIYDKNGNLLSSN
ncbi:MAG: hypothetical protein E7672_00220 [Ruminococcaceae bacterium]|nr:hypothetical protein [Oscillospiraceae bacterium]